LNGENNVSDYRCVVAMVDVPSAQVPEGILNFARCHRKNIRHVRIVTYLSEEKEETVTGTSDERESGETLLILGEYKKTDLKNIR